LQEYKKGQIVVDVEKAIGYTESEIQANLINRLAKKKKVKYPALR